MCFFLSAPIDVARLERVPICVKGAARCIELSNPWLSMNVHHDERDFLTASAHYRSGPFSHRGSRSLRGQLN